MHGSSTAAANYGGVIRPLPTKAALRAAVLVIPISYTSGLDSSGGRSRAENVGSLLSQRNAHLTEWNSCFVPGIQAKVRSN